MTTQSAPFTEANFESDLGYSYVFAKQSILLQLQDRLDVEQLGVISLLGDFAGSGSDVIRVTHMGNVGFQLPMAALASETDTITPSTLTTGYSTVAMGMYGLGHAETYKQQIVSRELAVLVDQLKLFLPDSWAATLRALVCSTGAGFTTAIGSASTNLSIDDYLDFIAAWRSNRGAKAPSPILHSAQVNQILDSARNEPAFQESAQTFQDQQGITELNILPNFLGLKMTIGITNDVTQSGGAYQGFGFSPGGIGWARASTMNVKPANAFGAMLIPEFGLVIENITSGGEQSIRKYEARSFFGVAAGEGTVFLQRRLISKV